MRIAYVTLHWPRTINSSTGKKILRHLAHWRKDGNEVRFFSHSYTIENKDQLVNGDHFYYTLKGGLTGRIQSEISRIRAAKALIRAVKSFQPDLIYLRWSMYVYPAHRLLRIAPTAVEINTNDIEEHKLLGRIPDLYNRWTRGLLLGLSTGHIYATREMAALEIFQRYHKPGVVVTNSLELKNTPYYPPPNNTPPHLLFIGTPGMPWHGVEKLVILAENYPDIIIDVVGLDKMDISGNTPDNLRFYGFLRDKAYEKILANADAAIGTLALHLKGMNEAATLKIRDCVARGIPCILPYQDTDFSVLESEYFLQIPNTADNIQTHGQAIYDFLYAMRGKRIPRALVFEHLDSEIKETNRLNFFAQLLKNQ